MEEERRLAYVAITRARKKLYLCFAQRRMLFGSSARAAPSQFLYDIPPEVTEFVGVHGASDFFHRLGDNEDNLDEDEWIEY